MGSASGKLTKEERDKFKAEYGIPEGMLNEMTKSFKKEANKDGKITKPKFLAIFGQASTREFSDQLFGRFDRNGDGTMDIKEFLTMLGVTYGGSVDQKLRASFEMFDINNDGKLTQAEVREMFIMIVKQKWKMQNPTTKTAPPEMNADELKVVDEIIQNVFAKVDTDKNGTLDMEEFTSGFSKHPDVCQFFMQF
eukprot:TRINITY_DN17307_c0_g1_i1.p1 TRINITY_DN17307_c0_g1~~TRINITY_DN17307_c0_g1_i1.p1  ORF type:complete len:194 (+),score=42.76 TRINITY_DN17307_c0_g1_i1:1-582(+)